MKCWNTNSNYSYLTLLPHCEEDRKAFWKFRVKDNGSMLKLYIWIMIVVTGSDSLIAIERFNDEPKAAQLVICAVLWLLAIALACIQKKFPQRFVYVVPVLYFFQHVYDLVKAKTVFDKTTD